MRGRENPFPPPPLTSLISFSLSLKPKNHTCLALRFIGIKAEIEDLATAVSSVRYCALSVFSFLSNQMGGYSDFVFPIRYDVLLLSFHVK